MTIARVFQLKPMALTWNSQQRFSNSLPSLLQNPVRLRSSKISTSTSAAKPGQLLVRSSRPVSHNFRPTKRPTVRIVECFVMALLLGVSAINITAPALSQTSFPTSSQLDSHYKRLELSKTCFQAAFLIIVAIGALAESNDRGDKRTRVVKLQIGLDGAKDMVKQNQTKPPTAWIVDCIVVALLLGAIAPRGNIIAHSLSQTSSSMWSQLDIQCMRVELATYGFQAVVLIVLGKNLLEDLLKSNGRKDKRTSVVKLQIGLRGALQSLRQDLDIIRSSNNDSIFKIRGMAQSLSQHLDCCFSSHLSADPELNPDAAEKRLAQLSAEEKLNYGKVPSANIEDATADNLCDEYMVITILVAMRGVSKLPTINSLGDLKNFFGMLRSLPVESIQDGLVMRTPEKKVDTLLFQQELDMAFPDLKPLEKEKLHPWCLNFIKSSI